MQVLPRSRFALATIVVAAISALFAMTLPARAEAIDAASAAPGPVADTATSAEPAPVSTDLPEPVEAPEASATATDSAEATVESAPAPMPAADQVPAATSSPSDSVPTANLSAVVPAAPVDVPPVEADAAPDATVSPAVHGVERLVERTAQSSARTAAPQQLSEVTAPTRKALDPIASAAVEHRLPAAFGTTPQGPGPGGSPNQTPSFGGPSPTGAFPGPRAKGPEGSLAKFSAGFGGIESSRLGALGNLRDFEGSPSATIGPSSPAIVVTGSHHPGSSIEHFSNDRPAPLDGPGPLPGSPGAAAPGSGGSFFVPIAALLALLALAAPATFRRLWEVPDFSAPTPFVCALERPG